MKNSYKSNFGNLFKSKHRATGFSKEGKAGVPAWMLKRKNKPDAAFVAYLKLLEMPFRLLNDETGLLLDMLDLLESWGKDERNRLQQFPW